MHLILFIIGLTLIFAGASWFEGAETVGRILVVIAAAVSAARLWLYWTAATSFRTASKAFRDL